MILINNKYGNFQYKQIQLSYRNIYWVQFEKGGGTTQTSVVENDNEGEYNHQFGANFQNE